MFALLRLSVVCSLVGLGRANDECLVVYTLQRYLLGCRWPQAPDQTPVLHGHGDLHMFGRLATSWS
jgi:hypothetical protein